MAERKFKKLELHRAFVQARLVQGYRYLDLSGVVLNRLGDFYEEISIDPSGGLLHKRKDIRDPYSIRFSPENIWLQYAPVESLEYVVDTAPEWINSIARDIEVKNFRILGFRAQYFIISKNIIKTSARLARKFSGDILREVITEVGEERDTGFSYMVRIPVKNYITVIRIESLRITRPAVETTDYPGHGSIFDVDVYWRREGSNPIPRAETKGFLKSSSDVIYNFLDHIGYKHMEEEDG